MVEVGGYMAFGEISKNIDSTIIRQMMKRKTSLHRFPINAPLSSRISAFGKGRITVHSEPLRCTATFYTITR